MKNRFFMILGVLLLITLVAVYAVYSYRNNLMQTQKLNRQYETYQDIEILGSELISIINKTIDTNIKNGIERDKENYFIDNQNNTIKIYVEFIFEDDIKLAQMEELEKAGSEKFMAVYSTESFKCTNIEYHEKTKNVKSLTFTELVKNY